MGINPAPTSVAAGHYYQGRLGQRIWGRLRRAGLLAQGGHRWEDDAFVAAGNGLTDLVKRPTATAAELSRAELIAGQAILAEKVRQWRPGLLLFAFRPPAEALLGPSVTPGACGSFESVPAFLLSPPYAASVIVEQNLRELMATVSGGAASSGSTSRSSVPIAPRAPAIALSRPEPVGSRGGPTQRVTQADLAAGRIRLPALSSSGAKSVFPERKGTVAIALRGVSLSVHYDPRMGPDRERSGVLTIGGPRLRSLVSAEEVLTVTIGADGRPQLD